MASKILCKYFYSVLMVVECHSHGDLATIDIVQILSEFFFFDGNEYDRYCGYCTMYC